MRVLLITPKPSSIGGIARWTEAFLKYSNDRFDTAIVDNSLFPSKKSKVSKFFSQIKRTATIMSELSKEIRKRDIDVAHINTSCSRFGVIRDYYCALKLHRKSIPIVLQCHCNIEDQLRNVKLSNFFFKKLVGFSDRVLVLNKKSLNFVKSLSANKGEICPNFISRERVLLKPNPTEHELTQITYVGHMYKSKGVCEVLKLAKDFPDITFKFVGPCEDFIKNATNVPINAHFMGAKSPQEVIEILDESNVFILLSYSEGFSNAMLEAMARGLPIIATDVGAARDMIEENGGVIVDVGDYIAAMRAIEFMRVKAIREQMSLWNLQKVEREYTSEAVLVRLEGVYESLAK